MSTITALKKFAWKHKFLTTAIIVVLGALGYWKFFMASSSTGQTKYVLTPVEKGTIISTVTGTGQVSSSNQIDLKPKASGDILKLPVKAGQQVKTGDLIAQLDATDAYKAVRDAQVNLENAKISLQKLQQPADTLSLLQSENALTNAQDAKANAESDLTKAYTDALTTISNAFGDLPNIMAGMHNTLLGTDYGTYQSNYSYYESAVRKYGTDVLVYENSALTANEKAQAAYDTNFLNYKKVDTNTDTATIETLLDETYATSKIVVDSLKSTDNFLSYVNEKMTEQNIRIPTMLTTHQTNTSSYTDKANTHLAALLAIKNTIKNAKESILSSDRTINEKQASLEKLKAGTDKLDLISSQLSVTQRENALRDAQTTLTDYSIRAPFDGTIAKVNSKVHDTASSGTAIATLVTPQQLAEITLNEVDIAKIKVGMKATLTFDAIENLSITGEVAEVDTIGTVSQGVVTYAVKINFDTQDERVKPGMSVSAAVITSVKQDVLTVPNGAIKTQNGMSYVEMLDQVNSSGSATTTSQGVTSNLQPRRQTVEIGASNDTLTEITSGLNEGDLVISRTISSTAAKTTQTTAPSLFGGGGGNNRTTGGVRIGG